MTESVGRMPVGRMPVGRSSTTGKRIKKTRKRVKKKAEFSRDKTRKKLLELRKRTKLKVKTNEEKMDERKKAQRRGQNPTFVSVMPSRDYAKSLRNPANWSAIPKKTKYSEIEPKIRIYGKRFDLVDEKGELKKTKKSKTAEETKETKEESKIETPEEIKKEGGE